MDEDEACRRAEERGGSGGVVGKGEHARHAPHKHTPSSHSHPPNPWPPPREVISLFRFGGLPRAASAAALCVCEYEVRVR